MSRQISLSYFIPSWSNSFQPIIWPSTFKLAHTTLSPNYISVLTTAQLSNQVVYLLCQHIFFFDNFQKYRNVLSLFCAPKSVLLWRWYSESHHSAKTTNLTIYERGPLGFYFHPYILHTSSAQSRITEIFRMRNRRYRPGKTSIFF